jgi:hypothetical protein
VLFIAIVMFSRHYACDLEGRITGLERIVHFIQDQVLVVLVIGISRRTIISRLASKLGLCILKVTLP